MWFVFRCESQILKSDTTFYHCNYVVTFNMLYKCWNFLNKQFKSKNYFYFSVHRYMYVGGHDILILSIGIAENVDQYIREHYLHTYLCTRNRGSHWATFCHKSAQCQTYELNCDEKYSRWIFNWVESTFVFAWNCLVYIFWAEVSLSDNKSM
jgi:hypothetical protein